MSQRLLSHVFSRAVQVVELGIYLARVAALCADDVARVRLCCELLVRAEGGVLSTPTSTDRRIDGGQTVALPKATLRVKKTAFSTNLPVRHFWTLLTLYDI